MLSLKKLNTRLITMLLAAALLLGLAACAVDDATGDTDPDATEAGATPETESVTFNISSVFKLIRPEDASDEETAALTLLNRGLSSVTGQKFSLGTDWVKNEAEIVPGEYEILVGETNRTQSKEIFKQLKHDDYTYQVLSENVIVIIGGSPAATYLAACQFMSDIYGYAEDDSENVISAGKDASVTTGLTSYLKQSEYLVKTLKIAGFPVEDYVLVSPRGKDDATNVVINAVAAICGYNIPIIKPEEYSGSGPVIFIGCSDAQGNHLDMVFDSYTYYVTAVLDGDAPQIIIDTKSISARRDAAQRFVTEYISGTKAEDTVNIALRSDLLAGLAFGTDSNGLILSSVVEKKIADGIMYYERLYYDVDNKPVRAYVLTVTKGSGIFYTGTPGDGEVLLNKNSRLTDEMKAAANNGKNVIAGINADFFDMGGTSLPRGLCVKEGKLLSSGEASRPWFGVLNDGTPVIGTGPVAYEKYASTMVTAVGGSDILLAGGRVYDVELGKEFGYTRHPRTAVGYCEDGTIVLLVVDGRQTSISNGASLADLAIMFRELDCTDAVNLDGGGSTTFVLGDGANNFTVKNSPSGGSLRYIQNSLLVLLP